ncbi:unnamed protein product [Tuber aestivum]|uniref:Uncharacterized protein n=1 Tax=Tuber aestivum TaxID=59557 RepID=A0A292PYL3_9PEZI|nr:unnamed protein product [Tuber aestivum]
MSKSNLAESAKKSKKNARTAATTGSSKRTKLESKAGLVSNSPDVQPSQDDGMAQSAPDLPTTQLGEGNSVPEAGLNTNTSRTKKQPDVVGSVHDPGSLPTAQDMDVPQSVFGPSRLQTAQQLDGAGSIPSERSSSSQKSRATDEAGSVLIPSTSKTAHPGDVGGPVGNPNSSQTAQQPDVIGSIHNPTNSQKVQHPLVLWGGLKVDSRKLAPATSKSKGITGPAITFGDLFRSADYGIPKRKLAVTAKRDLEQLIDNRGIYSSAQTTSFYCAWEARYSGLNNEAKWVLASGNRVENIIYSGSLEDFEIFCTSLESRFIIDTGDPQVKEWFWDDEWNEITARLSPLPDIDHRILDAFEKFNSVKTPSMLHQVLESGLIPDGTTYDQTLKSTLQWAEMIIARLRSHNESWLNYNIWSPLLDSGLQGLPGLTIQPANDSFDHITHMPDGGEPLVQVRKTPRKGMQLWKDFHKVICTADDPPLGYGGMADGVIHSWGTTGPKTLGHDLYYVTCLHEMLHQLNGIAQGDSRIMSQVKLVGIFTAGFRMQYVLLEHTGAGHICLVQRGPIMRVPASIGNLPQLIQMLVMVIQLREVIRVSREAIQQRH